MHVDNIFQDELRETNAMNTKRFGKAKKLCGSIFSASNYQRLNSLLFDVVSSIHEDRTVLNRMDVSGISVYAFMWLPRKQFKSPQVQYQYNSRKKILFTTCTCKVPFQLRIFFSFLTSLLNYENHSYQYRSLKRMMVRTRDENIYKFIEGQLQKCMTNIELKTYQKKTVSRAGI